ncbi:trypsin-like serine peptidase [Streptomyces sp. YIM B13508]|uniref:trypsin-like serine peptidase n=1 Tax=Streptomyces sp. YIM B13508 TaxID=3366315 RepID=UPI0036BAAB6C
MREAAGLVRDDDADARWRESADQIERTRRAVRSRNPELANSKDEIARRKKRLAEHHDREGIVDVDDSVWASFFSRGLIVSQAVGRVVVPQRHNPPDALGTGVLVAPGLLMTNNHVLPFRALPSEAAVEFAFEHDENGQEREYHTYRFAPDCWFTDEELDFTVLAVSEVDGRLPGEVYGWVPLIEETGKVIRGDALNVIHHPRGYRKRMSIRENRMVAEDELWLRYTTDTQGGSSGAPVFNDQWEMVALHHEGIPKLVNGGPVTLTGEPWTPDMGRDAKAYVGNEGARVSKIVQRLKKAETAELLRGLITQALTGEQA